jgi:nitrous oxidase accessory protein NosD
MIVTLLTIITANPATIEQRIAAAKPGDTIKLAAGDYGTLRITGRRWNKPISIDATGATMRLVVDRSSGISFEGGTFGPNLTGSGYAARVVSSSHITFSRSLFRDSKRGLVISKSTNVTVNKARFIGLHIDGVNIASSRFVKVLDSVCQDFTTGPDHPDCIQGWSRPGAISSDILIQGNRSVGTVQGIFFGNHVRKGVDDGGFDRVIVRDNKILGSRPQGIGLYDCRACAVIGNEVRTIPGSPHRVSIKIVKGTVLSERNEVGPKR